ncbi:MAG: hypothetical protein HQ567_31605, partial [Candidatus Nealsonbacteria bacterium]|nr:hypothetical protein [Candidatus Nealsonbacteria bacterium]
MKTFRFSFALAVLILTAAGIRASEGPNHWSGLADDAPCLKEQWPQVRTLVWSKPGEGGTALEPGNWTEYVSAEDYAAGKDGKPADAGPDASTDLILPDAPAGQSYIVGYMVRAKQRQESGQSGSPTLACRHITIGAGAALDGGIGASMGRPVTSDWPDDDTPIDIHGNVTVNDGGYIYGHLHFVGGKHTWFSMGKSPEPLGRSLLISKAPGASVTFMASQYDLVDGVTVESGRLVLAPRTSLRIHATLQARIDLKKLRKHGFGRGEAHVWVRDKAALEMQAGSRIGRVNPPDDIIPDMRVEGLLQIDGAGDGPDAPAVIELTAAEGDGTFLNQPGGLYIGPTAEVRNLGVLSITAGNPDETAANKGVSIFLENQVDLGKVSIDYLRAGGIASTDPTAARTALAAATFGEHCVASGDAIYSEIEITSFQGGFGTVEFVDGLSTECEVLFPLGDRLVVRSKGNRIAQSFDLACVCAVEIDGKRTEYYPKRTLTPAEQQLREVDALWADVPGTGQIGNYGKQNWPKAPLMVWRRPGESGSRFVAANWLDETGRPYFQPPIGVESKAADVPVADILLPAADICYQVVGDRPQWRCRHMTIESNSQFFLTYTVTGNLWMKDGSGMHAPWFGKYANPAPGVHRFLRFDGMRLRRPGRGETAPQRVDPADWRISQWGCYQTAPEGTLEIIGKNHVNDQFRVTGEGTLIISEGSYLSPGLRACFAIQPEATVVLLQDARISVETTAKQEGKASVWVGGTLMIGTPQRPITRDMLFPVTGIEEKFIIREPAGGIRTPGVSF